MVMMLGVTPDIGRRPCPAQRVKASALAEELECPVGRRKPEPGVLLARTLMDLGHREGAARFTDGGEDRPPLWGQPCSCRQRLHGRSVLRMILNLN
jgi:hypothetical protein